MSAKNKWLIKSDHKILGPYTFEQVEDLVMKKQISLIDEIRDMDHRWSFVREVPDFKNLVEIIRRDTDKKSDLTQTLQTAFQKTTTRAENTEAAAPNFTGVELDIPVPDVPPVVVTDIHKERKILPSRIPGLPQASTKNRFLQALTVVALLCSLAFGGWYFANSFTQNQEEKAVFQQIRKYQLYAQDEKSIDLFKKLAPDAQEKILVDIIPLWPKLEAVGLLSQSQILDLMTKGKIVGNDRKSQYQLIKFNKALGLGDTQNARDALVKAIDLDPASIEVKENNAIFNFIQKKYAEASKDFKNLYDLTSQGKHLYGFVLSSINAKSLEVSQAYEMLDKHLKTRVDYGKELLFLQLYIIKKFLPQDSVAYQQSYDRFIQFPFHLRDYFKTNALISRELYTWDHLKELQNEAFQERESAMMKIHFLIEKSEIVEAQEFLSRQAGSFSDVEKFNLNVALNYIQKNIPPLLMTPPENMPLYTSTLIYLLYAHSLQADKSSQTELQYLNQLMKDKQLFSHWAQLMQYKLPNDKESMKALVHSDSLYANDFLPYLEVKAALNE